jgi:hypothetical protein
MSSDPITALTTAIKRAGNLMATAFARNWAVPTLLPKIKTGHSNAEAGGSNAGLVHRQYAAGYDGTVVVLPFTANVSLIEGTGLSDDLVVG